MFRASRPPLEQTATIRGTALLLALTLLVVGCGARSELRVDHGTEAPSGAAGAAGGGGAGGHGGTCPVDAFAGDRSGGLRIVLDADHAYWTTIAERVERGSLLTGSVEALHELSSGSAALALTTTHVIVVDTERIGRSPKQPWAFETLASGSFLPTEVIADGQAIYVLDYGGGIYAGRVYSWTPQQGLVELLDGLSFPRAMATDGIDLFVLAQGFATGGEHLAESLIRMSKDGSAVTVLASTLGQPFGVAADAERVYWGTGVDEQYELDGQLFSLPTAGGEPSLLAALGTEGLPVAFAIDETSAFITVPLLPPQGPTVSRLLRVPLSPPGADPTVVLEEEGMFFTVPAVSPTHLAVTIQAPVGEGPDNIDNVLVRCRP